MKEMADRSNKLHLLASLNKIRVLGLHSKVLTCCVSTEISGTVSHYIPGYELAEFTAKLTCHMKSFISNSEETT